jgi:hypothetical protein
MTIEKKIRRALLFSKETGRVVAIRLKRKMKPLITAVEELTGSEVIVKPTTFYGHNIPDPNIALSEIVSVRCLNCNFEDPMFVRLRYLRYSIQKIRSSLHTHN